MSAKSRWQSAATAAAAASTISSKTKSRKAQRGVPLNMMVVGSSGLGKSTFVRSLVEKELIPTRAYDEYNDLTEKTVEIVTYSDEIEADGQKILLTVIDTPGFGDNIDNSKSFLRILEYTETQHKRFLAEETRVQRNAKFQDTRVHVILYFISPTGHYLKDLDIVFMKQLGKRANIIPVIGKADTLLPSELKEFKARLMEDIQKHGIPIFDFPVNSEDDEEIIKENKDYRALLPFSIVTSNDVHEIGGEQVPARKYPWGTVLVSDPKHSDFESLKVVLLISHLEVLKEITNDVHYEHFREESLTKAGGTLESKQIEDELKEFETLENEIKEKLKSQRDKRVSLKLEKSVKRPAHPRPVSKTDSKSDLKVDKKDKDDTDSIDEGKKKKKPKKSGSSVDLLEEGDEKKKKKKKKKDDEDGKEEGKEEGKEDEE